MNQLDFEKLGIPTVTVATEPFMDDAKTSARGVGVNDMAFVVLSHPMGGIPREDIRKKADLAFDEILKSATQWKPKAAGAVESKKAYPAARFKFKGTNAAVNKLFFEKRWAPGLPIVPPTPELVAEMLKGTSHRPDEVLWEVPPRGGILTVELVATHAVMAGCKPEYMPVLLSIIEGLKSDKMSWRSATTTTDPNGLFVIVNGPIVKKLGIAYDTGAAGGWYLPNVSIGYAINLIGDIVGGSKPPDSDKSTLGYPGNIIATVVGENEDANPWDPFHVEKGFKKTDNVVTVYVGGPPVKWQDHYSSDMGQVLKVVADTVNYAGQNGSAYRVPRQGWGGDVFLVLNREFAALLKQQGWTKDSIRKFLYVNGRHRLSDLQVGCKVDAENFLKRPPEKDELVPAASTPDQVQIIVVGGEGKQGQYWPTCPGGADHPVMTQIDKWN